MGLQKPEFAGKEQIICYYNDLLEQHGDSHLTLDWNSKESQEVRYAVLTELIGYIDKRKNISILDVGCGLGHFYDFLKKHDLISQHGIIYSGIDISEKLIKKAKKKNPEADFKVIDLLEDKFDDKFDLVMACGVFSIRMADIGSHMKSVYRMISRLYKAANVALGINFISKNALYHSSENEESSRYMFFSPEKMLSYCKTLTNKYILRHDYHPGDFTVYLFR